MCICLRTKQLRRTSLPGPAFHSSFRVVEVQETRLTVQPVDKPDEKTIRVAFNRVRLYPEPISNDEFWPPRRKSRRGRPKKAL